MTLVSTLIDLRKVVKAFRSSFNFSHSLRIEATASCAFGEAMIRRMSSSGMMSLYLGLWLSLSKAGTPLSLVALSPRSVYNLLK